MNFENLLSTSNISASGLAAERMRMEVIANNIANANSTRSPGGGPYRRQDVVFAAALNQLSDTAARDSNALGGVQIVGIVNDTSDFQEVYNPGHPDADAKGIVQTPNVFVPVEMVNLITASRAYEANMRVLQSFRQMGEQSLAILRS